MGVAVHSLAHEIFVEVHVDAVGDVRVEIVECGDLLSVKLKIIDKNIKNTA